MIKINSELLRKKLSILIEKTPYFLRLKIDYFYNLFLQLPQIVKYSFKDFSHIELIGSNISIDASSMCKLKCPLCPTGKGINKEGPVGWGYLTFKDFKNFIDKYPFFQNIEISKYGEIFLNPDLSQILKYACAKNINLTAYTGVNLNDAKKDILESLVKYKFKTITVSLDGASKKTYEIYRRGGDFDKVIHNIKIINHFKKKYKSKYPELYWQFIIMGHNEHELPVARKMANDLDMKFYPKLNTIPKYFAIENKKFVKKESRFGITTREEFFQKYKRIYLDFNCSKMWISPQINWDGKLLGCGKNIWVDFGNVFEEGLRYCLNNRRYIETKLVILGKKKVSEEVPCYNCQSLKFITRKPLKKSHIFLKLV